MTTDSDAESVKIDLHNETAKMREKLEKDGTFRFVRQFPDLENRLKRGDINAIIEEARQTLIQVLFKLNLTTLKI